MTAKDGIAVALGAGGARGLAHVVVLEALDELGLKPVAIAGTSMGAIVGAAYAAGASGRDLRGHIAHVLKRRHRVMAHMLEARVGRFVDLFTAGLSNPVLVDGEKVLGMFWPALMPARIEDLPIPLIVVATDFFAREEVAIVDGPLMSAVAGSMAIPGLVRPVSRGGRALIDGAAVNPLPYDLLSGMADTIVACDVVNGPVSLSTGVPSPFEAMFGAAQIMQGAIIARMLRARPPDVLVRPPVDGFKALDFFAAAHILRAAEAAKDGIKRDLDRVLSRPHVARPDPQRHRAIGATTRR